MNLPNKISMSRIVFMPVMVFFYLAGFVPYGKIIAAGLFILLALTDILDGKIARRMKTVTDLGKFLDPIADKVLAAAALILVVADGTIPSPWGVFAAIITFSREFIIAALRQAAAAKGKIIAADKLGKLKTVFQNISYPFLFVLAYMNEIGGSRIPTLFLMIAGYAFAALGVLLAVISGVEYMVKNKN
jgi:CDP-diacylglycerol--glycerol-3-phosphate 3-phosphatidyltransferase